MTHDQRTAAGPWPFDPEALDGLSGLALWAADSATGRARFSPALRAWLGLAAHEPASLQRYVQHVAVEDRPRIEAAVHAAAAGADVAVRHRLVRADTTERCVRWSARRLDRDDDFDLFGAVVDEVVGVPEDEARRRQERLAEELAGIGTFTWSTASAALERSPLLDRLLGLEPGARLSQTGWARFIHPDDRAALEQAATALTVGADSEAAWTGRLVRADGEVRHAAIRVRRLDHASGPVFVGSVQDLTEQHALARSREDLRRMEALTRLAGTIAHDFNNLLLVIVANASLLDAEDPSVQEILEATAAATELSRRLLAFGTASAVEAQAVDLAAAVDAHRATLEALLGPDVALEIEHEPAPIARTHRDHVEQILTHLALNARAAIVGGGSVVVRTSGLTLAPGNAQGLPPGPYATLEFADDGAGMDEPTLRRAFEPFFTTGTPGVSTGLGLSLVFSLVQGVGGAVHLDSAPGRGTRALLWFPEHTAGPELSAVVAPPPSSANPTVLVLEDERAVRRVVQAVLERAGYTVYAAADPDEALALAAELPVIDLVLSDVVTPGGGGERLVAELTARGREFRLLYMTGYAPPQSRLSAPVLLKPFLPHELREAVGRALEADT